MFHVSLFCLTSSKERPSQTTTARSLGWPLPEQYVPRPVQLPWPNVLIIGFNVNYKRCFTGCVASFCNATLIYFDSRRICGRTLNLDRLLDVCMGSSYANPFLWVTYLADWIDSWISYDEDFWHVENIQRATGLQFPTLELTGTHSEGIRILTSAHSPLISQRIKRE